jgi:hypothetical protein
MKTNYIKLAQYLDKIGKYSQADNVDKFIKSAQQYSFNAPGLQSGRRIEYQGYFDATGQARQQAGFGAGLQQGVGIEGSIVGKLAPTPQQYMEWSRQPGGAQLIFDYTQKLGEDMAKDAAQYTGPNRFQQMIGILSQRLSTETFDAESQKLIFKNYIEQFLIAELTTVIMNNSLQNIKVSIATLRNSELNVFPDVNNTVIPTAINTALISMSRDSNADVKQRYNQFIADPEFRLYTQQFSPVQ